MCEGEREGEGRREYTIHVMCVCEREEGRGEEGRGENTQYTSSVHVREGEGEKEEGGEEGERIQDTCHAGCV